MGISAEAIRTANRNGDSALIGYLPLGFPSVKQSVEAAKIIFDNGVDVIELGFPYSDPGMDGPVIQSATVQALDKGTHLEDLLEAVAELSDYGVPTTSMTYWNPVHWYGVREFAKDFAQAGGAGLITPDLPPEEAGAWVEASDEFGLERIFLTAPSSSEERLSLIANASNGWVYAASTMGVTGDRAVVDSAARTLVERTRQAGADLVCVGIGVKNGEQAREIGGYANGVIVGSAFVRHEMDSSWADGKRGLAELARNLKQGVVGAW